MAITPGQIGTYDDDPSNTGMGRFLTAGYRSATREMGRTAQDRRARIRKSVEDGTARYDKYSGQPLDPESPEFADGVTRERPPHTGGRKTHGFGAYLS